MASRDLAALSDVDVGGWINEDDGSTLYDHLDNSTGEYVHSNRRHVKGPTRVLFLASDDGARWPMDWVGTITSGVITSRVGELARQQMDTRIRQRGTNFTVARTDHCPCSPGRNAFMNGLRYMNHGNELVDLPPTITTFISTIRDGSLQKHRFDRNVYQTTGPTEKDCNLIAARKFFDEVDQGAPAWVGGTHSYSVGDWVKQTITTTLSTGGTVSDTRFYKCQTAHAVNRPPNTNSSGPGDEWIDYGSLSTATSMAAQQVVDSALQPAGCDTRGGANRIRDFDWGHRIDATPGVASDDDLQLTGGWNHWLSATGRVKCYAVEKFQNGIGQTGTTTPYDTADPLTANADYWDSGTTYALNAQVAYLGHFYTSLISSNTNHTPDSSPSQWSDDGPALTSRHVPSGWRRFVCSADDLQDHYRNDHIDFDELIGGENPYDGEGQIGRRSTLQYDYEIVTTGGGLTYNSGTNKITVVVSTAVPGVTPGEVLDISVDRVTGGSGWNHPEVSATCVNSTTFTFTPTGSTPSGTPVLTSAFLYVRKYFQTYWYGQQHVEMLNDVSAYDNIIVYQGFHMPHWSTMPTGGVGVTRTDTETQNERRYENSVYRAVPTSQAYGWGGTLGNSTTASVGPDVDQSEGNDTSHRGIWSSRQNMFCSQDDAIGAILDAWDAKFGEDTYYIICLDDNGYEYGGHHWTSSGAWLGSNHTEYDAWAPVGGKTWMWENSVRISLIVKGPEFPENVESSVLCELADIPLTILRIFQGSVPELDGHHAFTKRDGEPLQDKLTGVVSGRHQFCAGKYMQAAQSGSGQGPGGEVLHNPKIVDEDGNTFIRLWQAVLESTTPPETWISGHSYVAGDQIIYSNRWYTCILATSGTTAPSSDAAHWGDQYAQLFLGAGTGSGTPDESEYETVNHLNDDATTLALAKSLSTTLTNSMIGRWLPSTGTHTGKL